MHEVSIARNVVDHVVRSVDPDDLDRVGLVRLRIGDMSGVVADSLEFCFSAIVQGTPLEHARIEIESLPFVIRCRTCGERSSNVLGIAVCELCGSSDTHVESGMELDIVSLELREQLPV